ncbi:MAG TPA: hypothetical protein VMG10_28230 [Gemmataceae bacterium]|nr:hypothetical protein [Gemmataceae bacterium]
MPEHQTPTTEVRGRLMGPRCPYSSTVEVAYPLRPLSPSQKPTEPGGLTRRVIIPEAILWEPQCPFLYEGPIELWQDGQRCERVVVRHGMRSLQWKEHALHVNGRPLTLRGQRIASCSDQEATLLHEKEYNLFIAPVTASSLAMWEQADRFGFLVLGQLGEDANETRLTETLRPHVSCLGWLSAECRALTAEEAVAWYMAHGNPGSM